MPLWTQAEDDFLREHYPTKGKCWCMEAMGKTEAQIRMRACRLKLRQDRSSEFFKEWQERAAQSKIGKKRPEHAECMREMYYAGRILQKRETSEEISARVKEWLKTHEHPRGFLGGKHSEKTKAAISLNSKETWANMTDERLSEIIRKAIKTRFDMGKYATERKNVSWKGGRREVGGQMIYFRSRWEANYARYLDWLKRNGEILDWGHEIDLFWFDGIKRGCVSYLPDFKVTLLDGSVEYHEVKGWFDANSKTKLKRMAKYHPDVRVIVIDGKQYRHIEKIMAPLLADWEYAA